MTHARLQLQELAAPAGWSALLLRQQLPVEDPDDLRRYRDAVGALLSNLPEFADVHPEEVLLLFDRLRPGKEIEAFRSNARGWMPEFGMGVWLDRDPPATWSEEEFEEAAPGTLRPPVERVVRIQPDAAGQQSAWRLLLGSGALVRVSTQTAGGFVSNSTDWLRPTITDASLTSFSFYVPLLQAETFLTPSMIYDLPLSDQLPAVAAYLRESVEGGGLFMLVRQQPEAVWKNLLRKPMDIDIVRIT